MALTSNPPKEKTDSHAVLPAKVILLSGPDTEI